MFYRIHRQFNHSLPWRVFKLARLQHGLRIGLFRLNNGSKAISLPALSNNRQVLRIKNFISIINPRSPLDFLVGKYLISGSLSNPKNICGILNRMRYQVFSNAIVHELLEEEVIIANLDNGVYYSLRGAAAFFWQMAASQFSADEISKELADCEPSIEITLVCDFLKQMVEEKLLTPCNATNKTPLSLTLPKKLEPYSIEKYDEMRNLLMLDPIHEVDEQGWPIQTAQL